MSGFWSQFLAAAATGAVQGAAAASSSGADIKTVGVASGAAAIAGILQFILSHPLAQHPSVSQGVANVSLPPVPPG